jgi:hypothetical protein
LHENITWDIELLNIWYLVPWIYSYVHDFLCWVFLTLLRVSAYAICLGGVGSDLWLCQNFVYFHLLNYLLRKPSCVWWYILRCWDVGVMLFYFMNPLRLLYNYENELGMYLDYWRSNILNLVFICWIIIKYCMWGLRVLHQPLKRVKPPVMVIVNKSKVSRFQLPIRLKIHFSHKVCVFSSMCWNMCLFISFQLTHTEESQIIFKINGALLRKTTLSNKNVQDVQKCRRDSL